MSLKSFESLKPEWQGLFMETAVKVAAFERKIIRDNEQRQLKDLKAWGMDVRTVDKSSFFKAMQPVYDKYIKKDPGWEPVIKKITETG